MPFRRRSFLAFIACIALINPAQAGDWTVGIVTSFDRAPDNFSEPLGTKIEVSAVRAFGNGLVLGVAAEPDFKTDNKGVSSTLEGTFGYIWQLGSFASLGGSAGVGEEIQRESSGGSFPYYVLRVRADIDLGDRWSWNLITYRFRDAFNSKNDFNTPEVSTALTLKIDENRSVLVKYYYAWKDGDPDNQGIGLGYKYHF
jgi:hypothetical protein